MKVVAVPVRSDNYAYLLIDDATANAAAVDPYDVGKVASAASALGVKIVAGLTTHHHEDHSGGNKAFAEKYPGVPIYGGSSRIPALTNLVKDKDEFTVGHISVKCLATPCHTQDSICYYVTDTVKKELPGGVFTGDTLFTGGCGRFFEGTAEEMDKALTYLGTLPDETVTYVGHEYTSGNAAFAWSVDSLNPDIARLVELAKENKITAGLTTIGDEKKWNVFMRLTDEAVRTATSQSSPIAVMDKLREMKNNFRG
ncbi:Metallo-hydrolase/oxidoreductase [Cylindrobasidium torrendii FP15055 ss-10]|uniref:hydroxyacylglutathione hydrolase n=1 Tax=Cylindrobasidium torrendii FP15055 ss-10 TaxID=1314674 RepID=A0A0D7B7F5_9AGAR|nr:Metallo-hydrolase/oxidoreductase [Cylindrobasidium torrendii FP15055 ss-10]